MSNRYRPIGRKKLVILFLFISTVLAILRYVLFPHQVIWFHILPFIASFLAALITWESILFFGKMLEKFLPLSEHLNLKRIFIQVVLTFGVVTFNANSIFFMMNRLFGLVIDSEIRTVAYVVFFFIAVVYNLVYFGTIYFNEWKDNLVRNERLQRQEAEVRYDALRNQLNPHFLFNALSSLNSLIFENQQLASDFLQQLSKMFRYTLLHKNNETVAIKTEIDFIDHFVFLIQTRFAENVKFQINIAEEDLEKGIVPVTLQVLVENALKHNVISKDSPLSIRIFTDGNYLTIANSLNKKINVETSNKIGLTNLKTLYGFLTEQPVITEERSNEFVVKIPLL